MNGENLKILNKLVVALASLVVLAASQSAVFASIEANINSTFDRSADKIVVLSSNVPAEIDLGEIEQKFEQVPGVLDIGWTRTIAESSGVAMGASNDDPILITESTETYLSIVFEAGELLQHCESCRDPVTLVGADVDLSDHAAVGEQLQLMGRTVLVGGSVPEPIRGRELSQSLIVPVGALPEPEDQLVRASVAVRLNQRPAMGELQAFASILNESSPEAVQIEAAVVEDSSKGSILETIASSSSLLSKLILGLCVVASAGFGYFGVERQKEDLALLRSLGAANRYLHKRVLKLSVAQGITSLLVASCLISLIQPFIVGLAEAAYVPPTLSYGLLVMAVMLAAFVGSALLGLRSAISKDPAEVLRSL